MDKIMQRFKLNWGENNVCTADLPKGAKILSAAMVDVQGYLATYVWAIVNLDRTFQKKTRKFLVISENDLSKKIPDLQLKFICTYVRQNTSMGDDPDRVYHFFEIIGS